METEPMCDNCKFWKPLRELDHGQSVGMCRRHPPTAIPIDGSAMDFQTKFPRTEPDTWCGEHVSGVVPEEHDLELLRTWAAS